MKSSFKSKVFNLGKGALFWLFLILLVIFFSIQPVQGASLITEPSGPECNFTSSIPTTIPSSKGEPTKVSIGIYLLDIVRLYEIKESFEAKFFMKLQWQDPRLAQQLKNSSKPYCHIDLDNIWHPQAYVYNQRQLVPEFETVVSVNAKGTVTYQQIFDAELGSPLDFRKFPFDTQQLFLQIISLGYKPEEVEFVENQQINGVSDKLSFVGWSVGVAKTRTKVQRIKLLQRSLPLFKFEIEVQRKFVFIIWKSIFPLLIIVLATYLVFWLEPTQLIPQVSLTSITLLSFVTYQLNLASRRPQVPYLTGEDTFRIGSIVLIVLALIETIVTYNLAQGELKSLADSIDIWLRWLFPILLFGLILFAFL